jgi:hypothetical protein
MRILSSPCPYAYGGAPYVYGKGFDLSGEMHLSHELRPRLTDEVTNVGTSTDTSTQHTTQPSPPW